MSGEMSTTSDSGTGTENGDYNKVEVPAKFNL